MHIYNFELLIIISFSSLNFRSNMAANNPPPPRLPQHFTNDRTNETGFEMDLVTEPARGEFNTSSNALAAWGSPGIRWSLGVVQVMRGQTRAEPVPKVPQRIQIHGQGSQ